MVSNNVIVLPTYYPQEGHIRETLALETIEALLQQNLSVVCADGYSNEGFRLNADNLGAEVFDVSGNFNSQKRAALAHAFKNYSTLARVMLMEAEKKGMTPCIEATLSPLYDEAGDGTAAVLSVPYRSEKSLETYDPLQANLETATYMVLQRRAKAEGIDTQWGFFGPLGIGPDAIPYFINDYEGMENDSWLISPQLKIVREGHNVAYVQVDYIHPPEQKEEEMRNLGMTVKRPRQFDNVYGYINAYFPVT